MATMSSQEKDFQEKSMICNNAESQKRLQCQYFVLKKKRLCRMTVRQGEQYCGEHIDHKINSEKVNDESSSRKRVPCPYDSKHTCYKHQLAKHILRCNSKPIDLPSYIIPGLNVGSCTILSEKVALADISDDTLLKLLKKVDHIYEDNVSIVEHILEHPALSSELNKPEYGAPALKHLVQNSSLLGHMQESGLLLGHTCYIELGAGKGKLTYWLAKALESQDNCTFALIDRSSYRHKSENKLKSPDMNITRIRADIGDLSLRQVPSLSSCQNVVAISKHLCGAATDLALRCVKNGIQKDEQGGWKMRGLVMALCCHHRCEWQAYVGKDFFYDMGLTSADFAVMCGLASWATCGSGRSRESSSTQQHTISQYSEHTQPEEEVQHKNRFIRLNMSQEMREQIGRKCKHIIDYGRCKYLEKIGFKNKLIYYVKQSITLENVCIIGTSDC